ncbi:MAG: hypothetical protein ABI227_06995 [Rhodanobacter sp.]
MHGADRDPQRRDGADSLSQQFTARGRTSYKLVWPSLAGALPLVPLGVNRHHLSELHRAGLANDLEG